jgi:alpha-beta hydrolase superfamily lysophospholipase
MKVKKVKKETVQTESFDGTMLNCEKDLVGNPRAIVLIIHGVAEHLGRYDYVTDKFNSFGYSVYRYDQRGHGRSGGERGFFPRYDTLADDANVMVDLVRKEDAHLPVFVLGHSMGGMSAVGFSIKYPDKVRGIILSGALCVDLNHMTDSIPANLPPMTPLPNQLSSLICSDHQVVKAYEDDPLVLKEISVGLFRQIKACLEWFNSDRNLQKVHYPVLILHGGADMIVLPQNAHHLYDNISSTDKEVKVYEGLYHEILNEKAKDEVIKDIHGWIEKRLD